MQAKVKRRSAPEIIGTYLGADMREVLAGRYQSTRYSAPAVYVVDGDYFCAPAAGQKSPSGFAWKHVGTIYGRRVLRSPAGEG